MIGPGRVRRPRAAHALLWLALAVVAGCGSSHRQAPDVAAARHLFVHTGCGECHALADAHSRGRIGPDLDTSERLDREQIRRGLEEGANGMPSYAHDLSPAQRRLLTEYLLRVAWRRAPH